MTTDYGRFQGDGRVKITALNWLPGTNPWSVTRTVARRLIDGFNECGHSTHSGQGATLWVLLEWCAHSRTEYTLQAVPGQGYYVQRCTAETRLHL